MFFQVNRYNSFGNGENLTAGGDGAAGRELKEEIKTRIRKLTKGGKEPRAKRKNLLKLVRNLSQIPNTQKK